MLGLARSYSNGLRAGYATAWGRHGVLRLDWRVEQPRYRNTVSSR